MPKAQVSRKALFRAALAVSETTAEQFAARAGVSPTLLSFVVNGKRERSDLTKKIDDFITKHVGALAGAA